MNSNIRPHHQRAIDNLVAEYENDPRFQAIIIGGSVAKGCAREDSDIDFMIVANDQNSKKESRLVSCSSIERISPTTQVVLLMAKSLIWTI